MTHADRHDRNRWMASGLPDAVITIMFRDGTLPPPHAARWYDSALTTEQIGEFRRTGRAAPDAAFAASLEACGLPTDPDFVARWDGFDSATILDAIDRGFTSGEQFRPWAATDADVTEVEQLLAAGAVDTDADEPGSVTKAVAQLRAGRTAEEIAFARTAGIKAKHASGWMERGLSAEQARTWAAAEFPLGDAAAWIEVVDEPAVARLLESVGFDVDRARAERPDGGWTTHVVRRHVAVVAGASEDEADRWAATALPDRKLAKWVGVGVSPDDAASWLDLGFRPAEAASWSAQDFSPTDAQSWRSAGVTPDVAARRRNAGVRPAQGS
jgi:hypothetical protein